MTVKEKWCIASKLSKSKPLEEFSPEELQHELRFMQWLDDEFGLDDDGTERMETIGKLISSERSSQQ